jgi:ankyrin repeat protein
MVIQGASGQENRPEPRSIMVIQGASGRESRPEPPSITPALDSQPRSLSTKTPGVTGAFVEHDAELACRSFGGEAAAMTPALFDAIANGDATAVAQLVESDPSLAHARNADGVSAIVWARYVGKPAIAEELLSYAGDLDLFEAASAGLTKRVRELLDFGRTRVDDLSPDGFTALHLAAFFGHDELARELIAHGATLDCHAKNDMSVTPLHSALAGRHNAIAKALVDAGADVDAVQQGGWTPLHAAAQHGDAEMVSMLLAKGADKAAATEDGTTAADLAAAAGHTDLATQLRP